MLRRIVPKVFPEVIAQGVSGADLCQLTLGVVRFSCLDSVFRMQYRSHQAFAFGRKIEIRPVESTLFPESYQYDPLTVLRKKMTCVQYADVKLVTEVLLQYFADDVEGSSFVVALQILHVLEEESSRSVNLKDTSHIEKQGSLSFIEEAMLPAQRVLLGHPGNGEWLAWKPR